MNPNRRKFLQDVSVMMALLFSSRHACASSKSSLPKSCTLQGSPSDYNLTLLRSSGNRDLDRSLNLELHHLAASFEVLPGFGFYDDGHNFNAFATSASWIANTRGTVVFGKGLLSKELNAHSWGGLAIAGIIAHEFGHIYQYQSGYYQRLTQSYPNKKWLELHADYLAGYYLGLKRLRTGEAFDIKVFADSVYMLGDSDFNAPDHHGTPIERMKVMIAGYKSGLTVKTGIHHVAKMGINLVETLI